MPFSAAKPASSPPLCYTTLRRWKQGDAIGWYSRCEVVGIGALRRGRVEA